MKHATEQFCMADDYIFGIYMNTLRYTLRSKVCIVSLCTWCDKKKENLTSNLVVFNLNYVKDLDNMIFPNED